MFILIFHCAERPPIYTCPIYHACPIQEEEQFNQHFLTLSIQLEQPVDPSVVPIVLKMEFDLPYFYISRRMKCTIKNKVGFAYHFYKSCQTVVAWLLPSKKIDDLQNPNSEWPLTHIVLHLLAHHLNPTSYVFGCTNANEREPNLTFLFCIFYFIVWRVKIGADSARPIYPWVQAHSSTSRAQAHAQGAKALEPWAKPKSSNFFLNFFDSPLPPPSFFTNPRAVWLWASWADSAHLASRPARPELGLIQIRVQAAHELPFNKATSRSAWLLPLGEDW